MQPSPAAFRDEFAEFKLLSDDVIQAKLDQAYRRVGPEMWGELRDDAAKLLAAHLISISPLGEPSTRSVKGSGLGARTVYLDELDRLRAEVRPFAVAVAAATYAMPPGD